MGNLQASHTYSTSAGFRFSTGYTDWPAGCAHHRSGMPTERAQTGPRAASHLSRTPVVSARWSRMSANERAPGDPFDLTLGANA
jgi:hypothetical protein